MARIVMILNRLVIGGAPLDTVQLAGFLSEHHEVYLIVGEKSEGERDAFHLTADYPKLRVMHLPAMKRSINLFKDMQSFWATRKLLKQLAPDIVHTHGAKSGFIGRLAAASVGLGIIIHTYHGHVFHSYFNALISSGIVKMERWLARFTTAIIAISHQQKKELVGTYKICAEQKVEVVKLGLDASLFVDTNLVNRKRFREYYKLEEDTVAIGIVGRIVPIKGYHFFANVVEQVLKIEEKKVCFFVVGDGELREDLMQVLTEKHIGLAYYPEKAQPASVIFTSWMLDMPYVMAGLDIVVLTSLNEGTPLTLLEAQAASKPVVSTNVGAVSEIVLQDESGFIMKYGDTKAFVKSLQVLINDKELRQRMGESGRRFVVQTHTKQQQYQGIDKLYKRLLGV